MCNFSELLESVTVVWNLATLFLLSILECSMTLFSSSVCHYALSNKTDVHSSHDLLGCETLNISRSWFIVEWNYSQTTDQTQKSTKMNEHISSSSLLSDISNMHFWNNIVSIFLKQSKPESGGCGVSGLEIDYGWDKTSKEVHFFGVQTVFHTAAVSHSYLLALSPMHFFPVIWWQLNVLASWQQHVQLPCLRPEWNDWTSVWIYDTENWTKSAQKKPTHNISILRSINWSVQRWVSASN